jgi:hypothetical protein
MTTDERIERLTGIVESLSASVVAHDSQIEGLIRVAERHQRQMEKLERQWQAYIRRLPPQ